MEQEANAVAQVVIYWLLDTEPHNSSYVICGYKMAVQYIFLWILQVSLVIYHFANASCYNLNCEAFSGSVS